MDRYSAGKHGNIRYERIEDEEGIILGGKIVKQKVFPSAQEIIDEII